MSVYWTCNIGCTCTNLHNELSCIAICLTYVYQIHRLYIYIYPQSIQVLVVNRITLAAACTYRHTQVFSPNKVTVRYIYTDRRKSNVPMETTMQISRHVKWRLYKSEHVWCTWLRCIESCNFKPRQKDINLITYCKVNILTGFLGFLSYSAESLLWKRLTN